MTKAATPVVLDGSIYSLMNNARYLHRIGVEPMSTDDTQFGTENDYCNQHRSIHSAGWCTVPNAEKLPDNGDLPEELRTIS